MTTNFQPGDEIKAGPFTADIGLTPGKVYTVNHIDDFGQVQPDTDRHYHYHPSHFELVERAAPAETYCLLDGEGDWWVYKTEDPAAEGYWYLVDDPAMTLSGSEEGAQGIIAAWGIDAEPLPAATGVEMYDAVYERTGLPNPDADPAPFAPGDRVEYVGGGRTQTPPLVGKRGTVASVGSDDALVDWDDRDATPRGVLAENLRKVTDPAPLQPGEWVQVWASIYDPRGDADEVEIRFYNLHDTRGVAYTRRDAIVRPAEGQTPPWVEEPERKEEEVEAIAAALQREGGMSTGTALQMAESLHRAGVRAEVTER